MVTPEDDFPHPVPPQAFMTWKENWVFPAVDTETARRVALPLLAAARRRRGDLHRQVLHRRLGAPLRRPLARAARPDDLRAGRERAGSLRGRRRRQPLPHHLRRRRARRRHLRTPAASTPGTSTMARSRPATPRSASAAATSSTSSTTSRRSGTRARSRSRPARAPARRSTSRGTATATIRGAGARISRSGTTTGCARRSRPLRRGHVMNETCYPHGDKFGGWISTEAGNEAVADVDTSDAYWLAEGEPLPQLDSRRALPRHDRRRRERDRDRPHRERLRPPLPQRALSPTAPRSTRTFRSSAT